MDMVYHIGAIPPEQQPLSPSQPQYNNPLSIQTVLIPSIAIHNI